MREKKVPARVEQHYFVCHDTVRFLGLTSGRRTKPESGVAAMPFRKTAVFSVLTAITAGIVAAILTGAPDTVVLKAGTALPQPRAVADFDLVDQHGRALTRENFRGHWSLVFAGFTNCPDICPTTLALLATVMARLRERGAELQSVFVSVDPERDSPLRIAGYLAPFGADLVGATGTAKQTEFFTGLLGLAYLRNPGTGGEYTVDHSAALVLIDPKVRMIAYFQPPHDPDTIVADLSALMSGAG